MSLEKQPDSEKLDKNLTSEKVNKPLDVSPQEAKMLKNFREKEEIRKECAKEIDVILVKYKASLSIDQNSPYGNPGILIVLNQ